MTTDTRTAIAKEMAYVSSRTAGLAARAGLGHEADDIASAALLTALGAADRFDGSNLRGWLLAIIRGEIANRRRHSAFRLTGPIETAGPGGELRLVVEPSTDASQEMTLQIRELDAALPRLPPEQAEVVRLITIGGAALEEAAHTFGIPLGTVKSRLSRGLAAMREMLEHGPPQGRSQCRIVAGAEPTLGPWILTSTSESPSSCSASEMRSSGRAEKRCR